MPYGIIVASPESHLSNSSLSANPLGPLGGVVRVEPGGERVARNTTEWPTTSVGFQNQIRGNRATIA